MAGGGGDIAEPRKHGKGKKRKKGRRLGIRIDMTPLVDVAFLLLTFFMFTTSMSRPQTMEINLPPNDVNVEIAESNLLTLRITDKAEIYWAIGIESPKKVEMSDLRKLLREQAQMKAKLVTLVKINREGKFKTLVNIIDELNLANIERFSIAPMTDQDKALLSKVTS